MWITWSLLKDPINEVKKRYHSLWWFWKLKPPDIFESMPMTIHNTDMPNHDLYDEHKHSEALTISQDEESVPRRLKITFKGHFFIHSISIWDTAKNIHGIKTKRPAFAITPDMCNEWVRPTNLPAFNRPKLNRGSIPFTKNSITLIEIFQQLNWNLLAS